jgi:deoxyadenosine/deoxycytidine kinase
LKPFVAIEGNIGVGKSTLVEQICKILRFRPIYEPVESNPYLVDYYQDQRRHAFPMQIHLMTVRRDLQRLAAQECICSTPEFAGVCSDRTLAGDYVFLRANVEEGNISEREASTYHLIRDSWAWEDVRPPTYLFFLDASPETALRRIVERDRSAEAGIRLSYLQRLDRLYRWLMSDIEAGGHPWFHRTQVHRIPWDSDYASINPIIDIIRSHM